MTGKANLETRPGHTPDEMRYVQREVVLTAMASSSREGLLNVHTG